MANGFGFERIIINELDLTAQGFATENTNVAFVPGLMGTNNNQDGLDRTKAQYKTIIDNSPVYKTIQYIVNFKPSEQTSLFIPNGYPVIDSSIYKQTFKIVGDFDIPSGATLSAAYGTTAATTVNYVESDPNYISVVFNGTASAAAITFTEETPVEIVVKITLSGGTAQTLVTKTFMCYPTDQYYLYNPATQNLYNYRNGTYITPPSPVEAQVLTSTDTIIIDANYIVENAADTAAEVQEGLGWFQVTLGTQDELFIPAEETPILCDTIAKFETYFGRYPYKFTAEDNLKLSTYTDNGVATDAANFCAKALPYSYKLYNVGDYDRSYIIAKELINRGMPVLYDCFIPRQEQVGSSWDFEFGNVSNFDIVQMYSKLESLFTTTDSDGNKSAMIDKSVYSYKYLTSGGFPFLEYISFGTTTEPTDATYKASYEQMLDVAAARGDAYVIADPLNNPARPLKKTDTDSLYACLEKAGHIDAGEYGAIMPTWYSYNCQVTKSVNVLGNASLITNIIMPPSFSYLCALADQMKNNPAWLATAGVTRGQVPNFNYLYTNYISSQSIADSYQEENAVVNINAITEVKPYGYCIYGNRTTFDNSKLNKLSASSFLNIRNMLCDVKKTLYRAAQKCLFEQNTDVLWINFKSMVTPLLDQMVTSSLLEKYKFIKINSTEKGKLDAQLILTPVYAVEKVEVTIILTDSDVQITE